MSNTAINTLKYTGIVTLSQYSGTKKIKLAQAHNAGANPLFNFLSDCLVGDFDTAKLDRPTKIKLLKKKIDSVSGDIIKDEYESASPGFIGLTTKPEKIYSPSQGAVRYSFIISRDLLQGTTFDGIGLYTDSADDDNVDINNFAAFCEVKDLNSSSLSTSSVLVVDWLLTISNPEGSV